MASMAAQAASLFLPIWMAHLHDVSTEAVFQTWLK
jgi:hypothetical protein